MNKRLASATLPLLLCLWLAIASCSDGAGPGKKTTNDAVAKTGWQNPRKGKIWEKENVVHIPLSANENHILGPVKSVSYREYELPGGNDSTKVLVDSGYNEYDQAGYLVAQNEYSAAKMPKITCRYMYDGKHKPTEWDIRVAEDNVYARSTFKYDQNNGTKIEELTEDSIKENSSKIFYKYDKNGNEVEADVYNLNNKLQQIFLYKYDQRGFQTGYGQTGADRKINFKMECDYDDKGNKTGGTDYSSDAIVTDKWTQKNDSLGRRIETDYFQPDGSLLEKRLIRYDEAGYPVEFSTYKPDGSLDEDKSYAYRNSYDKVGNIVQQTEIRWIGGKQLPITYTEYVITYY